MRELFRPLRCPAPGGVCRFLSRVRIGDGPWVVRCSWCGRRQPDQKPRG